jgi:predicted phage terminase large subunit-like protein
MMARPTDRLRAQAYLQAELLTRAAKGSLSAFVRQAWSILEPTTPLIWNWHLALLIEYLEAITAGELHHLLITMPPRSMKSLLVSILWPCWEWIRRPTGRWIFAAYAETLATKQSVDRRRVLQSAWYQSRFGDQVRLMGDQNLKYEFSNHQRGHMIATSVGGSITGKGGDRIVVDDLHNPLQAASDAEREIALRYFRETLATRLDDRRQGAIVAVMQRLHERDLAACCVDLDFTHVCLPAEADTRTTIHFPRSGRTLIREPGDVLWPAREGPAELALQKRFLGADAYPAQYQQQPVPPGGAVFKRDWFRFYDDLPPVTSWLQSWDLSFKDGPSSDYVVGLQAARQGADIYLVDRVKGQWAFSETCRQIPRLQQRYPRTSTILIEDAANGPAIINVLRQQIAGVIPVTPEGGKYARAHAAQPIVEAGNLWLPNPRPYGQLLPDRAWVDDFVHQCCLFPHPASDLGRSGCGRRRDSVVPAALENTGGPRAAAVRPAPRGARAAPAAAPVG